jgi:DNA-binding Lrp family transcriptional regulator
MREIARKTSLATPTVSLHLSRMVKSGFIKRFVPVLDEEAITKGIGALVTIRVKAGEVDKVSRALSALDEATGIFVTTGENNITLKVTSPDARALQELMNLRLPKLIGERGDVISSELIVRTAKNEAPAFVPTSEVTLNLRCDYCKGEVATSRPYNIRVGSSYHYFCCKTCRRAYAVKYRARIASTTKKLKSS